jgi:enamine deaminase RidA (YjgF/YER057c/UK114 family)
MSTNDRLRQLGLDVPTLAGPFGSYVPSRQAGNLLFVAGQIPRKDGKILATGPVPSASSVDQARTAARQCVLNALAAAKVTVGDLDRVVGVVHVGAFVHSDPSFTEQSKVADAASDLLIEIFGDPGRHARAAVGVNTLPANASVEIEFVFELR